MSRSLDDSDNAVNLRMQALSKLTGHRDPAGPRANPSAAFAVLHELASSPETAADALALLHELQVHQVELDIQDEELRRSRLELETALHRQTQLYDFAPVGCFTVDAGTVVFELNLAGARQLGLERDAVLGRALDEFVTAQAGRALRSMFERVGQGDGPQACDLELLAAQGTPSVVRATCALDPAGDRFLVAFVETLRASTPTGARTSP